MPKEKRKRGPRQEKLRKRQSQAAQEEQARLAKRQRIEGVVNGGGEEEADFVTLDEGHYLPHEGADATPFYGLLNDEEQEYFRRADELLETNQFGSTEEKDLFLANVFKEAEGKQLKMACSQSCSRLVEKLILLSSSSQLKDLYSAFSGYFLHLVRHRFASHCCEALFLHAAKVVTEELTGSSEEQASDVAHQISVSMENLFLHTLNEFEGNLGYLLTDRYASHPLRVLIIVLSGKPLTPVNNASRLKSKGKGMTHSAETANARTEDSERVVPSSFAAALEKLISSAVEGLDSTSLRALATHPVGNPVLQLLLEIELSGPKRSLAPSENSILQRLLKIENTSEGGDSTDFLTGLMFDPVGSHLLETIVKYAPGKTFKSIYRTTLKEKIGDAARNEVANFVVTRVLERLGRDDLEAAVNLILPHFPLLVRRSRLAVIKSIIERYAARDLDLGPIAQAIVDAYDGGSPSRRLQKILGLEVQDDAGEAEDSMTHSDSARTHGSLLGQAMLAQPEPLSTLIYEGILDMPGETIIRLASEPAASRLLQASVTSPTSTAAFRRKFTAVLTNHVTQLAVSPVGSHLIDAMWAGTRGLQHHRERIAQELCDGETELRTCHGGRALWRNWKMDLYKQRRPDWLAYSKTSDGFVKGADGKHGGGGGGGGGDAAKEISGIERARRRFSANLNNQSSAIRAGNNTGRRT
ncbi:MAG: Nucleolar protein 9 [Peltula sp. TS41687]|nr:MAG: Nucleolar protein 9 [Peltula sp. TS41687]